LSAESSETGDWARYPFFTAHRNDAFRSWTYLFRVDAAKSDRDAKKASMTSSVIDGRGHLFECPPIGRAIRAEAIEHAGILRPGRRHRPARRADGVKGGSAAEGASEPLTSSSTVL
jgi:hypothetical protein